jgi:hypothetical protein
MAQAELNVRPGEVLAGKYAVERVLGQGGMGAVLAVRHVMLDERRALKLMLPSAMGGHQAVERFVREARAAARLKSDHVTRVHDVGLLPTGQPYIEMELLEGQDLSTILATPRSSARSRGRRVDAPGLRGAARGSRVGGGAPRSEAREPLPHASPQRRRVHQGARFRGREDPGRAGHEPDDDGHRARLAPLHVAGADVRREPRRAPQRYLVARRHHVPAAHAEGAVQRRVGHRGRARRRQHADALGRRAARRSPPRARSCRDALPPEAHRRAVRQRRGARRRPSGRARWRPRCRCEPGVVPPGAPVPIGRRCVRARGRGAGEPGVSPARPVAVGLAPGLCSATLGHGDRPAASGRGRAPSRSKCQHLRHARLDHASAAGAPPCRRPPAGRPLGRGGRPAGGGDLHRANTFGGAGRDALQLRVGSPRTSGEGVCHGDRRERRRLGPGDLERALASTSQTALAVADGASSSVSPSSSGKSATTTKASDPQPPRTATAVTTTTTKKGGGFTGVD